MVGAGDEGPEKLGAGFTVGIDGSSAVLTTVGCIDVLLSAVPATLGFIDGLSAVLTEVGQ